MMHPRVKLFSAVLIAAFVAAAAATIAAGGPASPQAEKPGGAWKLPPDARDTKNPLTVDDTVLASGKKVFGDKCQKCHGPEGLGDGPDADPEHAEHMNLTNPKRADSNPDGVIFHKVTNGRTRPKMPSFKDELSQDQIWSVVSYVQSLRKK